MEIVRKRRRGARLDKIVKDMNLEHEEEDPILVKLNCKSIPLINNITFRISG